MRSFCYIVTIYKMNGRFLRIILVSNYKPLTSYYVRVNLISYHIRPNIEIKGF